MSITEEIFKRATIRGYADYLIYKDTLEEEMRDYDTRMSDAFKVFDDLVEKHNIEPLSPFVDGVNELVKEATDVFTEVGLQAGILFMTDVMNNAKFNQCNDERIPKESNNYKEMYELLFGTITLALITIQDKKPESIQKAETMLKEVQCKTEKMYMDLEF